MYLFSRCIPVKLQNSRQFTAVYFPFSMQINCKNWDLRCSFARFEREITSFLPLKWGYPASLLLSLSFLLTLYFVPTPLLVCISIRQWQQPKANAIERWIVFYCISEQKVDTWKGHLVAVKRWPSSSKLRVQITCEGKTGYKITMH